MIERLFAPSGSRQSARACRIGWAVRYGVMDYEHVKERLVQLMAANDGRLTAALVEQDPELAANRELVSAAARELASEPDVIVGEETDAREWFPYSLLIRQ